MPDAYRRDVPLQLDELDVQRFSDAVSASLRVSSRPQFFSWLQSSVQAVLPHEILVCGLREGAGKPMAMHHFASTRYFRETNFRAVADPQSGLVPLTLTLAKESRSTTLMCRPDDAMQAPVGAAAALERLVVAEEMKDAAVQIVSGVGGQVEAIYVFARLGPRRAQHLGAMIEILTPHLHHTFLRVLANEHVPLATNSELDALVTRRQVQILNLVKAGKTNAEIAEVLGCSQWTVKNHVQSILRRLDTSSRAHAITRAISLGILTAD